MAIKSYNRIFNSHLPDMAGELVALEMEHDTDLNAFTKGNIDNMQDKNVVIQDYDSLIENAYTSEDN